MSKNNNIISIFYIFKKTNHKLYRNLKKKLYHIYIYIYIKINSTLYIYRGDRPRSTYLCIYWAGVQSEDIK